MVYWRGTNESSVFYFPPTNVSFPNIPPSFSPPPFCVCAVLVKKRHSALLCALLSIFKVWWIGGRKKREPTPSCLPLPRGKARRGAGRKEGLGAISSSFSYKCTKSLPFVACSAWEYLHDSFGADTKYTQKLMLMNGSCEKQLLSPYFNKSRALWTSK